MSRGPKATERVAVTIVSTNPETLDGLRAYLCGADVEAECARVVEDVPEAISAACRALVIFSDDFPPHSIESTLDTLHDRHPNVRLILVTCTPKKFEHRRRGGLGGAHCRHEARVGMDDPGRDSRTTRLQQKRAPLSLPNIGDFNEVPRTAATAGTWARP